MKERGEMQWGKKLFAPLDHLKVVVPGGKKKGRVAEEKRREL